MAFKDNSKVYKFDPTLPRLGKGKYSTIILTEKLFKENKIKDITFKEFQSIWIAIAEEIKEEVCKNPLGVKLPYFLGELKIQFLPYKMQIPDNQGSQEVGEEIPHANIHSKGKNGKLIWERKAARKFNPSLDMWAYEAADLFENDVSQALFKNPDIFRIARTRVLNKAKTFR